MSVTPAAIVRRIYALAAIFSDEADKLLEQLDLLSSD
jgi:hypothetical protein